MKIWNGLIIDLDRSLSRTRYFLENESLADPCNPEATTGQILNQLAIKACLKGVDLENLGSIDDFLRKRDIITFTK